MLTGQLPIHPQGSIIDHLLGNMPGCIGEVSALAILLGALYLFWRKIVTWHIPVSYLGAWCCSPGPSGWPTRGATPTAVPSADRRADAGRLLHGHRHGHLAGDIPRDGAVRVGCGVLTVLIRLFGGYPEGVSFAILLMNAATR